MFDGISIQVTDQAAQAIEKLQGKVGELTASNLKLVADHNTVLVAKDEEIGGLKAQLADAKKAGEIDVEKLVADRTALIDTAKAIVPTLDPKGMKDADIRKAVVVAKLGDEAVANVSDAELNGMFKALTKDAKPAGTSADPLRQQMLGAQPGYQIVTTDSQAKYEKGLTEAWKTAPVAGK